MNYTSLQCQQPPGASADQVRTVEPRSVFCYGDRAVGREHHTHQALDSMSVTRL